MNRVLPSIIFISMFLTVLAPLHAMENELLAKSFAVASFFDRGGIPADVPVFVKSVYSIFPADFRSHLRSFDQTISESQLREICVEILKSNGYEISFRFAPFIAANILAMYGIENIYNTPAHTIAYPLEFGLLLCDIVIIIQQIMQHYVLEQDRYSPGRGV